MEKAAFSVFAKHHRSDMLCFALLALTIGRPLLQFFSEVLLPPCELQKKFYFFDFDIDIVQPGVFLPRAFQERDFAVRSQFMSLPPGAGLNTLLSA